MANKPAVTLTIAGDADKLSKATDQATKSVTTMSEKTTKASRDMGDEAEKHSGRMAAAVGLAGAAIGGFAVEGVRHLFELRNSMDALDVKAKTVFEGELPGIQAWAEQNRKAFGESTRNVVAMAANLADLLKPMGFTAGQAGEMSKKILDLSGALSRWTGGTRSAAEVSEILADAMLGETDSLKGLGISISAAEIDAKALSMGLGKTTVDMTKVREATIGVERAQTALNQATKEHGKGSLEARDAAVKLEKAQASVADTMKGGTAEISDQAKALATQQLILEKSTDAQTAWANGGRQAAEAQNGLSSTMAESAEKLAAVVAPVFERFVQILSAVADWISKNQTAAIVIGSLTAAVWLLNAAMSANPMVLLALLIAGVVAALVLLWTKSQGFRDAITGMWTNIRDTVVGAVDWIKMAWDGLVGFFAKIPSRIGQALGDLAGVVSRAFKGAVNAAVDALNWAIDHSINWIINQANSITSIVGGGHIPTIPHIPRMHGGGVVPGMPGTETLILAKSGERVSAPGQGGGGGAVALVVHPGASGAVAELINYLIGTNQIEGVSA